MLRRLLLVLLAFLVPGLAGAQGLGDVAARERQKREAAGPRAKPRVLSNDDLKKQEAGKPASQADASPQSDDSSDQSTQEPEPSARDVAAERQARMAQAQADVDGARTAVAAAEERIKQLGSKLNPMSPSFIYGASRSGDAAAEELRTREELRQAEAQLAQARDALVRAEQVYDDVRLGRAAGSSGRR